MNNAFGVGGIERVGKLDAQIQNRLDLHGFSRDRVPQGCAIQILHHDEGAAVLVSNFVDGADVGVVQGGCCPGLAAETFRSLRVLRDFIREELECDETAKLDVFGLVNHTHAAAELLDDAIVRDDLSDHWEEMVGLGWRQVNARRMGSTVDLAERCFADRGDGESLVRRGKCVIFTQALTNAPELLTSICIHAESETPHPEPGLEEMVWGIAPNPVMGLWTGCTRLKIRVLTSAYFPLTEKTEGVQQDCSLTAS